MSVGVTKDNVAYWVGIVWVLVFLFFLGRILHAYFTKKPSFAADNDGFSVMGKPKHPWSDFNGAQVKAVRVYFFPILSWVTVKTGTGLLAPTQQIQWGLLSDKPKKMVDRMNSFASKQISHGN